MLTQKRESSLYIVIDVYLFCCSFIFPFEQLFQFQKIVTKISKIIKLKNNFFVINNYLNLKYNN